MPRTFFTLALTNGALPILKIIFLKQLKETKEREMLCLHEKKKKRLKNIDAVSSIHLDFFFFFIFIIVHREALNRDSVKILYLNPFRTIVNPERKLISFHLYDRLRYL